MKRHLLYSRVISAAVMAALGTLALPQVPVIAMPDRNDEPTASQRGRQCKKH
jgi:hypothetical protein